ncbi:MAG: membrane protein insertase YidC [Alphaproteobacteria bacterium]|nr:membrane protein insertase YidC [Alphaproteobacteria bacterium]
MEKNITPGVANDNGRPPHRPQFFRIFLWSMIFYFSLRLLLGAPAQKVEAAKPENTKEIERVLVPFANDYISGNFNAVGLRIDDLTLLKYHDKADRHSPQIRLLAHATPDDKGFSEFVEFGLIADNIDVPTNATRWNIEKKSDRAITLSTTNKAGIKFTRELSIDERFGLSVRDTIANNSNAGFTFHPYARIVASHSPAQDSSAHTGFVGVFDDKFMDKSYSKLKGKALPEIRAKSGWFGLSSAYFLAAVSLGSNTESGAVNVRELRNNEFGARQFQADFVAPRRTLAPRETATVEWGGFLGAKEAAALAHYETAINAPRLGLAIDYGFFYFLSRPFTALLTWLNNLTGNFGVAIIILTIFIRILLFPIAQKSFRSMEAMKRVQPEMKRIQTMYASDKQRMSFEMAALFKKHKINPLSGCLPLLLQLPVFIALYQTLIVSIEMRHAPFMFWITDLSAHDPYFVLPILMGATMWFQMQMTPQATPDPNMAKVMKWLPLIFTFMFATLPSGLVLYWTVNNILSIAQQKFIK